MEIPQFIVTSASKSELYLDGESGSSDEENEYESPYQHQHHQHQQQQQQQQQQIDHDHRHHNFLLSESGGILHPSPSSLLIRRISAGEFSTISFSHSGTLISAGNSDDDVSTPISATPARISSSFISTSSPSRKSFIPHFESASDITIHNVEVVKIQGRSVVLTGTAESLINTFCTVHELASDSYFLHDFLLGYRLFLNPESLLHNVIKVYGKLEIIKQRDRSQWDIKTFGQLRLLNFLRKWFEQFTQDFIRNPALEAQLRDFLQSSLCSSERQKIFVESFIDVIREILGHDLSAKISISKKVSVEFIAPTAEALDLHNKTIEQNDHLSEPIESFYSLDPSTIAENLTHFEAEIFRKIPQLEFIDHLNGRQDYPFPNLSRMMMWSDRVKRWVISEIVCVMDIKERVDRITLFINVAKSCANLYNFNSVFEIMSGLLSPSVQRLTKTWKSIKSSHKTPAIWKELLNMISPSINYKSYCKLVEEGFTKGKSVIPWVKIYLSDLEIIFKGVTFIDGDKINFYKFHLIGKIIRAISHWQKMSKNIQEELAKDTKVFDAIKKKIISAPESISQMSDFSLMCEPMTPEESNKKKSIFHTDLSTLVERQGVATKWTVGGIPFFLRELFEYLETEQCLRTLGIFRTSGNQHKILELKKLIEDSNGEGTIDYSTVGVHDAAGVLKLFFREMKEPLFTNKLFNSYLAISKLAKTQDRIDMIHSLSLHIPDANRNLANYLLKFFSLVVSYSDENKMDSKNISVCFAPSLFGSGLANKRPKSPIWNRNNKETEISKSLLTQTALSEVLQLMIEIQDPEFNGETFGL